MNLQLTASQGRYTFDQVKKTLFWDVGRIDQTKIPSLKGNVSASLDNLYFCSIQINFTQLQRLFCSREQLYQNPTHQYMQRTLSYICGLQHICTSKLFLKGKFRNQPVLSERHQSESARFICGGELELAVDERTGDSANLKPLRSLEVQAV